MIVPGDPVREERHADDSLVCAEMAALGKKGTWESRSEVMVPAPVDIAARLDIPEADYCVRTSYEYLADGKPVLVSTSWDPYSITSGTLAVLPEGGPYAGMGVVRMAEIGIMVSRAVEQPEPRQASAEERRSWTSRRALSLRTSGDVLQRSGPARGSGRHQCACRLCEIVYEVPINS